MKTYTKLMAFWGDLSDKFWEEYEKNEVFSAGVVLTVVLTVALTIPLWFFPVAGCIVLYPFVVIIRLAIQAFRSTKEQEPDTEVVEIEPTPTWPPPKPQFPPGRIIREGSDKPRNRK